MADPRCSLPGRLPQWGLRLALIAGTWAPLAAAAQDGGVVPVVMSTPGGRGAQIYCFMRGSGNSHQVSWDAAYEVIKRQGGGLFRTSPQHAAVMITEAVVQSPEAFPNCGMHLGDLFRRDEAETAPQTAGTPKSRGERYGY
ncbi:DUF6554 family protein [Cyanobium sp. CH-040]|uniref:DUF6554 family protein n=1 Tax=Cyanobium sp. CH-040 TaxID=2823708 RepID=UPI0028F45C1D|nr:DUF6554 family protein [Cyanobium sp. CH-040]